MPILSLKLPETKKNPSNAVFSHLTFTPGTSIFLHWNQDKKCMSDMKASARVTCLRIPVSSGASPPWLLPLHQVSVPLHLPQPEQKLLGSVAPLPGSLYTNTVLLPLFSLVAGLRLPREHGGSGSDGLLFHIRASPGASATNWMSSTRYQTSNNSLPWWRQLECASVLGQTAF